MADIAVRLRLAGLEPMKRESIVAATPAFEAQHHEHRALECAEATTKARARSPRAASRAVAFHEPRPTTRSTPKKRMQRAMQQRSNGATENATAKSRSCVGL